MRFAQRDAALLAAVTPNAQREDGDNLHLKDDREQVTGKNRGAIQFLQIVPIWREAAGRRAKTPIRSCEHIPFRSYVLEPEACFRLLFVRRKLAAFRDDPRHAADVRARAAMGFKSFRTRV